VVEAPDKGQAFARIHNPPRWGLTCIAQSTGVHRALHKAVQNGLASPAPRVSDVGSVVSACLSLVSWRTNATPRGCCCEGAPLLSAELYRAMQERVVDLSAEPAQLTPAEIGPLVAFEVPRGLLVHEPSRLSVSSWHQIL
jgi:hypothetical protein